MMRWKRQSERENEVWWDEKCPKINECCEEWMEVSKQLRSLSCESREDVAVEKSCDAKEERREMERKWYLYSYLL